MPSITFKNANELRARRPGISNRVLKVDEIREDEFDEERLAASLIEY